MARSNYNEYTRLRDIAVKRSARLEAAGLAPGIKFPTVKELRQQGISQADAIQVIKTFTEGKTTTREFRNLSATEKVTTILTTKNKIATERQRMLNRERNRRYRERLKSLTKKERSYLKAAHTLGLKDVRDIKAFAEYMEMRFAQGNDGFKYRIANYVEDFQALMQKPGYTPQQITRDYQQFLADRSELMDRAADMAGITAFDGDALFSDFMTTIL